MLFTAIFSTISIIEDRREGFLQSVLVAPISPGSIVCGKILGGTTLALLQGLIFLLLAPFIGIASHAGADPGLSRHAFRRRFWPNGSRFSRRVADGIDAGLPRHHERLPHPALAHVRRAFPGDQSALLDLLGGSFEPADLWRRRCSARALCRRSRACFICRASRFRLGVSLGFRARHVRGRLPSGAAENPHENLPRTSFPFPTKPAWPISRASSMKQGVEIISTGGTASSPAAGRDHGARHFRLHRFSRDARRPGQDACTRKCTAGCSTCAATRSTRPRRASTASSRSISWW